MAGTSHLMVLPDSGFDTALRRCYSSCVTVLLTNDDGILSPGLKALEEAFAQDHEVWVVAPDGERSGFSNSITLSEPIRCTRVGERSYAISGTPADCVILATLGAIPVMPDLVVSGINIGANLGSDIVYSGTCAGARQAAYKKIPGIAVSLNSFHAPFHFEPVCSFLTGHVQELMDLWDEGHFININVPNLTSYRGVEITTPAMRLYQDRLLPFEPPRGGTYYFVDGRPEPAELEPGTDWYAVEQGHLSVSPIMLNPVNHEVERHYRTSGLVRGS
ncbi:5'/3'-nucleotidase SurE [Alkalispirochaeta sphaeroplastigenens]|uniref:5'/3'-nucleotidase SurE n=1 Tax=Alkalispirochaeta sphaeroplastigenens TaxID=1187066 RepID=UPI000CDB59FF|nr:5'/3'-nucleotidase SurE [Alkalispirochaeta sphaeroplastigenens]